MSAAPRIQYVTAEDGYRLVTRIWDHEERVTHVVYLHGIVSHGGWYHGSCAHLAQCGFAVHFLERRGSGLNSSARGDVPHWKTWLTDVESYLNSLPSDQPRIVLGISWGGTLAAAVARRGQARLDGLGLLCPGLFSNKQANAFQRGALRVAGMVGMRSLRVTVPLQDPALFTDSPEEQAYIAADPFTLRTITIRMALENLKLTHYATERPESIRVPTLLMIAGHDPITDNERVRRFVARIGHVKKRVIEYPNASHTLEFEPDTRQYVEDLAAWCHDAVRLAGTQ